MTRSTSPRELPAPLHHVVLITGAPGAGKTFGLQKLERLHRDECPGVVHDRLGYWDELPNRVVARVADPEEAARIAIANAPCTLYLDEGADAFPAQGWSGKRYPALNEVLKVGRQASAVGPWRRRGPVSLILATQRPNDVHPCIKSFVNRYYIGHMPPTATRDLEWIADAVGPEIAAKVPSLTFGNFEVAGDFF